MFPGFVSKTLQEVKCCLCISEVPQGQICLQVLIFFFFPICFQLVKIFLSYLGQVAASCWGVRSYSVHRWQPCQHSALSEHHVRCRFGRSPHARCPSDCFLPCPWMLTCYNQVKEKRREKRIVLFVCQLWFHHSLSLHPMLLLFIF